MSEPTEPHLLTPEQIAELDKRADRENRARGILPGEGIEGVTEEEVAEFLAEVRGDQATASPTAASGLAPHTPLYDFPLDALNAPRGPIVFSTQDDPAANIDKPRPTDDQAYTDAWNQIAHVHAVTSNRIDQLVTLRELTNAEIKLRRRQLASLDSALRALERVDTVKVDEEPDGDDG